MFEGKRRVFITIHEGVDHHSRVFDLQRWVFDMERWVLIIGRLVFDGKRLMLIIQRWVLNTIHEGV